MPNTHCHSVVFAGLVLFALTAVSALAPTVRGDSSAWIGEKPTDPLLTYPSEGNGEVTVSNKFFGNDVSMGVAVEVNQFKRDDPSGMNEYKISVLGEANSRAAHRYSVSYATDRLYAPCGSMHFWYYTCVDSGITGDDMGKWIDMPTEFYHYGRAYRRVFVCSNGWVSFLPPALYSGSWCSYTPSPLPTPDAKDANGNRIDDFDSIVAPLWRDLNPSAGGRIRIGTNVDDLCGFRDFAVFWEDVPNFGNGYRNNFVMHFWRDLGWGGDGQICPANPPVPRDGVAFYYGSVSSIDPSTSTTRIGVEDPSGALGFEIPASTPATYGIVKLLDPGASGSTWLASSRIYVNKQCCSASALDFEKSQVSGYNIRTSNPPSANDGTMQVVASVVEVVAGAGLCTFLGASIVGIPLAIGCLAIDLGIALPPELAKTLAPPPAPPAWQDYSMYSGGTTGFLEAPVRDERGYCGGGFDCDVDMALFDQMSWKVPKDSATHVLEIQFGVRMGSRSYASTAWYWTGVVIAVTPSGTLTFGDNFERNSWTPGTDPDTADWLQWKPDGLWHMSPNRGYSVDPAFQRHSARYGKEGTLTYDTGARNSGSLTGPLFNVRSAGHLFCYRSWWDTEPGTYYDQKLVQTSLDRGKTWTTVPGHQISDASDPRYTWVLHSFSLDPYVGKEVTVRFFFDTVDAYVNSYEGWYIDEVSVRKSVSCPGQATTTYTNVMAEQFNGVAYDKASGGAICSVTSASHWNKFYDDGTTRKFSLYLHFANYGSIKGKVWVALDAPGWNDEAVFYMDVYYNDVLKKSYRASNGGALWEGYQWSDEWTIGTSGTWKFVVTTQGVDYGSQTCWARGEFYLYNA